MFRLMKQQGKGFSIPCASTGFSHEAHGCCKPRRYPKRVFYRVSDAAMCCPSRGDRASPAGSPLPGMGDAGSLAGSPPEILAAVGAPAPAAT